MGRRHLLTLGRLGARLAGGLRRPFRGEAGHVPVLCYHRVLPDLREDPDRPLYTLLPAQFEAQLALLAREGWQTLSLREFAAAARGLAPVPPKAVLLTFDDGYADFHRVAWPLARKYGLKVNLFLTTGWVGRPEVLFMDWQGYRFCRPEEAGEGVPEPWREHARAFPELWRPLSWQELRELQAGGVGLGLHGHTHRDLGRLPIQEVTWEVKIGQDLLARHLNCRPESLALPYGGYASVPWAALTRLSELGISLIFTTIYGRPRLPGPPRLLPRLLVLMQDTPDDFRLKLLGAYDVLGRLQEWWWRLRRRGGTASRGSRRNRAVRS